MIFGGLPLFAVAIVVAVLAARRPDGAERTTGLLRAAVWALLGIGIEIAAVASTAGFAVGVVAVACFGALAMRASRARI